MKTDRSAAAKKQGRSKSEKERSKLYFPANALWFEIDASACDETKTAATHFSASSKKELFERAQEIYKSQCETFQSSRLTSKADQEWFANVVASGTLTDKASALSIAVQESGVYSQPWVEALLAMATKQNRREVGAAVENLKELFMRVLLPSTRKLCYFDQQPALSLESASKRAAVLWFWEDFVKRSFLTYLKVLEGLLVDTLIVVRHSSLSAVYELLCEKPEQEQNLLKLLLNKLGDQENKIASKTSFLLLLISQKHPNMIEVLIRETRMTIERTNATNRMIYYAMIFLNQIVLRKTISNCANALIELYFGVFNRLNKAESLKEAAAVSSKPPVAKSAVKKHKKPTAAPQKTDEGAAAEKEKLLAAILTGINRAFPFSDIEAARLDEYVDCLFRMIHGSNFNATIQSLNLLFSICVAGKNGKMAKYTDRFYRSFFEILADPFAVSCTSKQSMLVNLLFKVLKEDSSEVRVCVFFKRLLECATMQQPPFACAILLLLNQLIKIGKKFLALSLSAASDESSSYDRSKRDPLHAAATNVSLQKELFFFTTHFHPSVSKYAAALLDKQSIPTGWIVDPFEKFTVNVFLEKFTYKNPKALVSLAEGTAVPGESAKSKGSDVICRPPKGISAMQPLKLQNRKTLDAESVPLNKKFLNSSVSEQSVAADELFFYKFFTGLPAEESAIKSKRALQKKTREDSVDDASDDVASDGEIEDFISAEKDRDNADESFSDADEDEEIILSDEGSDSGSFFDRELQDASENGSDLSDEDNETSVETSDSPAKKKKKFKSTSVFADASEYLSD